MIESQFNNDTTFWQMPFSDLLARLKTTDSGLTQAEALERLQQFGLNVPRPPVKHFAILQFLAKFRNPLVIILLVASAISGFIGDITSFFIICVIVIMSVTLDFVQEYRAGQAADKLRQSVAVRIQVIRDGKLFDITATEIVPGDVVQLRVGDLVPADGRVIIAKDFFVNQSLLTGESYPVEKFSRDIVEVKTDISEALNSVFTGSYVVSGTATFLVCRTGQNTYLGKISDALTARAPATSFELGTQHFGLLIMRLTILLVLFVVFVNAIFHRAWLDSFLFAVALAVGLTPELLPMVVSVTLARGAIRMAKKKVIVKKLESINNLGCMDVLCTDKTGTLTEAKIHLERQLDSFGRENIRVLELAYLNSFYESGVRSPMDDAILEHKEIDIAQWKKIDEVPFDFERRRVSVLVDDGQNRLLVVKGAPEDILRLSAYCEEKVGENPQPMDKARLERIQALSNAMAREGFRVLGVAWKRISTDNHHVVVTDESDLVFIGFAAFLDPPKKSAQGALAKLTQAGVAVKIVTGDNELVTRHICEQLGMPVIGVLTGSEIHDMDDIALAANAENVNLFCRVTPIQKNRIILALKRRGRTVGYLGDGINDAPSLHSADVGMSVDGAVDVAKEAAEMILLEQDLNVLYEGVMEGRRTFSNIMKYIMMGTSSNFGNMFSMAGATLFLPFLPMLPVQILLNNLLYDISEIPIPLDNVDQENLAHPRQWDMNFIRSFMLAVGPISSIFDFFTFYIMLALFKADETLFHTGWFVESLVTQVLVIFVIRTRRNPLKSHPNKWLTICSIVIALLATMLPYSPLGNHLGFVPLPPLFYVILTGIILLYLAVVELIKQWFYRSFAQT